MTESQKPTTDLLHLQRHLSVNTQFLNAQELLLTGYQWLSDVMGDGVFAACILITSVFLHFIHQSDAFGDFDLVINITIMDLLQAIQITIIRLETMLIPCQFLVRSIIRIIIIICIIIRLYIIITCCIY